MMKFFPSLLKIEALYFWFLGTGGFRPFSG